MQPHPGFRYDAQNPFRADEEPFRLRTGGGTVEGWGEPMPRIESVVTDYNASVDGFVNGDDYDAFAEHFEAGC